MGPAGKWWAWKTDVTKKSCYTLRSIRWQSKKRVQGERGLIHGPQLSRECLGCPGHRLHPQAGTLGFGSITRLKIQSNSAYSVNWMNSSLSVNIFNFLLLLTAQRVIQSDWISSISQRGPNLVIQMYLFNPRLRHLVAVFVQHLYSSVFQTLNFPWNRCENQREHSDLVFCLTMKEPRSLHMFLPSCDTDAHLPSCSSGPYKFQSLLFLTQHFT